MVTRTHTLLSRHCREHSLLWTQCVLVLFRRFQTLSRPADKKKTCEKKKERRELRKTYVNLQVSSNKAAAIRWSLHALLLHFFLYKCELYVWRFRIVWCGVMLYVTKPTILCQLYIWEKRNGIFIENEKLQPRWYILSSRMQRALMQSGCACTNISQKMSRFVQV